MKRLQLITLSATLLLALAAGCKKDKPTLKKGTVQYVAQLESKAGKVSGTFTFQQAPGDPVTMLVNIEGLSEGGHAVHIHAKGDCSKGYKNVGPHFMGGAKMMKGMKHKPMGDIGNITADAKGVSKESLTSAKLSLTPGPTSIAGRAILVHTGPDSKVAGSAGAKVACGVIKPLK